VAEGARGNEVGRFDENGFARGVEKTAQLEAHAMATDFAADRIVQESYEAYLRQLRRRTVRVRTRLLDPCVQPGFVLVEQARGLRDLGRRRFGVDGAHLAARPQRAEIVAGF